MTTIIDLYQNKIKDQNEITILGWVRSNRNNNKLGFLIVNDGTIFNSIQIVYKIKKITNFLIIKNLQISSIVKIKGKFCLTPFAKQPFEIEALIIEIIDEANNDYPLQKKGHSYEYLRNIAHLRAKTNTFNAIFRIRSNGSFAIHDFFKKNNFIYINTPIITKNNAEGAGETFFVTKKNDVNHNKNFLKNKANLTVSGQLHAECFAQIFQKVYTFGPTFRAENFNTTRHISEFWMLEPEIAFIDLKENMLLIEKIIKYVINYIIINNNYELEFLNNNVDNELIKKLKNTINEKFIYLSYTEAIKILQKAVIKNYKFKNNNIFWGMELQTEHEKYLCEKEIKKPTFLFNYPKKNKAFYMKINNDNKTVAACDLLIPGIGELVGGSVRENNYDKLIERCIELKISTKDLQWYIDLRKYGYYKSAGFGMGFDRLIMYLTGMNNIRDVIPFPCKIKKLLF